MKDRLTLALCANASGNSKVKSLLLYHSDTPRAFKTNKMIKENLQVLWRANAKAWVTRHLFTDWVKVCFGLTVKKYLEEKRLPLRCLLLLNNAPAHPRDLEEDILPQYSFSKVLYLPPNTTPLLQPMDQQGFLEGLAKDEAENVDEPVAQSEDDEIVTLGTNMGLEDDETNINELIKEHQEKLMMDNLKELKAMQMNEVHEQFSSSDREDNGRD
ncbi:tigger transposable element-derived protein 1-like [Palaemon carinicauda]|uniref:tigger transposable element-derived protein 1-like n=1 Tax=Palaemon carinicauda TaxID=392227 RepID=UPI0035B5B8AC